MKRPHIDDLLSVAEWLDEHGDGDETLACARVATWMRWYAQNSEERRAAREGGCSVRYLRQIRREEGLA